MNWDIKACTGRCTRCNKDFIDGENFFCRLFLEESGPRREDFCKNCWDLKNDLDKGYSSWMGKYKEIPGEIEEEPIEDPILKHLLKKWINATERLHQCFCYVIALLLERNKTFSEKPSITDSDGKKRLVYEDRDTGETYLIEDPNLSLQELGGIEGQIQEMLKNELKH